MADLIVDANRTIPARVRAAVIARDGMACRRCGIEVIKLSSGAPYQPNVLHLDHVIPWAEGGPHTVDNLIVCCGACNLGRDRPTAIVRHPKIRVTYASNTYWWKAGYTPPVVLTSGRRNSWAVRTFGKELDLSPVQVLRLVVNGDLAASAAGSIRVEIPPFIRREQQAAERMRRLNSYWTPYAQDRFHLYPIEERTEYWRGLIEERRARQRRRRAL